MLRSVTLIGACAAVLFTATSSAQVVWEDNLDSYDAGSGIDGQGGWEPWTPGTELFTLVSNAEALSAPNSLGVDGADDLVRQFSDLSTGVYAITMWQFIADDATGGSASINLMNTFPAAVNPDWSTAVLMDTDSGMISAFSGETLPLVTGEWVEFRVVANLDADLQEVFYNGELLVAKTWTGGVSAGGAANIAAINLYGNSLPALAYYDDLSIEQLPPWGACCIDDGTCTGGEPIDVLACQDMGGVFQGIGSSCVAATCYELGKDGAWIVDPSDESQNPAGWTWGASTGHADTCNETDDCDLSDSADLQWQVTLQRDATYTFSVCDADFDTQMFLGSTICSDDVADNDDGCGLASQIDVDLSAGTYYLTLEGFSSDVCGTFSLNIREFCDPITESKGAVAESEACGDDTNGGCNLPVPAFEPIEVGVPVFGTHIADAAAGSRDTDWFEIIITEDTAGMYTFSGTADRTGTVFGFLNAEGTGNCVDATGVAPAQSITSCGETVSVTRELIAGTWWMFAAPQFGGPADIECGVLNNYEVLLSEATSSCTPTNDLDGNGFVEFLDLLTVLSNWAPEGCDGGVCDDGDTDCNGAVEFVDLLNVLSNWDPQP